MTSTNRFGRHSAGVFALMGCLGVLACGEDSSSEYEGGGGFISQTGGVNAGTGGAGGAGVNAGTSGAGGAGLNAGTSGAGGAGLNAGTGGAGGAGINANGGTAGVGANANGGTGGVGVNTNGGTTAGAGAIGGEPAVVSGCGSSSLYAVDEADPGAFGPWPVGVKTISIPNSAGALTADVWYPAKRGSDAGQPKVEYDLRSWLPVGAAEVPDSANRPAVCNCYRDLPFDADHGPYPAVVYIHGLGSFRIASGNIMALWASRGFVVVAADHPGDMLTDFLAGFSLGACTAPNPAGGNMASEAQSVLAALNSKGGDFAFLGEGVDLTRIGLGGHSQGGGTVAGMGNTPNVKVIITLAPLGGGRLSTPVDSMLQVTGMNDGVTFYGTGGYTGGRSPIRRLVGIRGAGHLDVTELCREKNPEGKTAIQVANQYGVCGALILSGLAQCGTDPAATAVGPDIVGYATTAALEETLHCQDRTAAFAAMQSKFPQIGEYLHTP